jgi:hypothetical protein
VGVNACTQKSKVLLKITLLEEGELAKQNLPKTHTISSKTLEIQLHWDARLTSKSC